MRSYKKIKIILLLISLFYGFNILFSKNFSEIKKKEKVEIKNDLEFKELFLNKKQNIIYNKVALKNNEKNSYRQVIDNGRSKNSLDKKYYLILEGTKFYGSTKYCHKKYNSRLLGILFVSFNFKF